MHVRHRRVISSIGSGFSQRVISIGSEFSHGHTDWPVDFVSKPGVASVSTKTWGCRTNPEGGGTGVCCWEKAKCRAAGGEWLIIFRRVLRSGGFACARWSLFGGGLRFGAPFSKKVENHPSMRHPYKGDGQKIDARNRTSAARQRRGFRRHLCPQDSVVFLDRHKPRASTPKLMQLPENH